MDLSNIALPELRTLLENVKAEIVKRERQEIDSARAQILAIAQSVGLPLDQLLAAKAGKQGATKGSKAPVQYRDPENAENAWTGRGRQPKWVKDWVEAGKPLEQLRVSA